MYKLIILVSDFINIFICKKKDNRIEETKSIETKTILEMTLETILILILILVLSSLQYFKTQNSTKERS